MKRRIWSRCCSRLCCLFQFELEENILMSVGFTRDTKILRIRSEPWSFVFSWKYIFKIKHFAFKYIYLYLFSKYNIYQNHTSRNIIDTFLGLISFGLIFILFCENAKVFNVGDNCRGVSVEPVFFKVYLSITSCMGDCKAARSVVSLICLNHTIFHSRPLSLACCLIKFARCIAW